jgi:hypothetical protein
MKKIDELFFDSDLTKNLLDGILDSLIDSFFIYSLRTVCIDRDLQKELNKLIIDEMRNNDDQLNGAFDNTIYFLPNNEF